MSGDATRPVPLITLADLADLAGVSRPAVSNWRKRFPDFPQPVGGTAGNPLFHPRDVEAWLRSRDKWVGRPGVEHRLWAALEPLRALAPTESFLEAFTAALTVRFLALVRQRANNAAEGVAPAPDAWEAVARSPHRDRLAELQRLAARMEARSPSLQRLLLPPLDRLPRPAEHLLEFLDEVPVDDSPRLLEAVVSMHRRASGRGSVEWTTSESLTELVIDMAQPIASTVYDGAAGAGGFLLAAARAAKRSVDLFGQEVNESAWRLANQRLIVHQLDGRVALGDTLMDDAEPELQAQTVLLDPPYSMANWSGDSPVHDRPWRFGVPGPNNADFAWVQHAVSHLAPGGRAFVLLPMSSLLRSGTDARIRHELIRTGAVEAVVELPRGLVSRTAIPLALWVFARPGEAAGGGDAVLLANATPADAESFAARAREVVDLYRRWQQGGTVDVGWAVSQTRLELLGIDATLVPSRWIPTPSESVDANQLITDLKDDARRLNDAMASLRQTKRVNLGRLARQEEEVQRASIGQLANDGLIKLFRGVRVPRNELEAAKGAAPVLTAAQVRDGVTVSPDDCPRVSADALDRQAVRTEPGDIVVMPEGERVRAGVAREGGAIAAAPLWVLRVRGDWIDPAYLAACLGSEWNSRHFVGSTKRGASVRDLEVPLLPPASQKGLVDRLAALVDRREQALRAAEAAGAMMQRLVDGVAAGVLDVGSSAEDSGASDA
jgi:type I restriction-modification system DNA methylase subunit/predicted DNA-binding transcriptional regulator AlpA